MATKAQCAFCFNVLISNLHNSSPVPLSVFELALSDSARSSSSIWSDDASSIEVDDFDASDRDRDQVLPMFVTWNVIVKGAPRLRGCIGTFDPQPLEKGLKSYARIAAFEDHRFSPITLREVPSLEVGVSLLMYFEDAKDPLDWEWGVHGIRISFSYRSHRYSATYLPDVPPEHFDSKEQTLDSLVRKAGVPAGVSWQQLAIKLVRYQSLKAHMSYAEYAELQR
ncbi:AMMECR1 domain-containing protein [Lipomyces japonicus]|uniref:AMMECR1 domain-containing protein n=1 Tax=Lipomyces japonicus TaxID=56871 RepID=UPI0034CE0FC4